VPLERCFGAIFARLWTVRKEDVQSKVASLKTVARSGVAGLAATAADLATLAILVELAHWHARTANIPALLVGGIVNFVGNRSYAFHARAGNAAKQAVGYSVVEGVALGLNGLLYEAALRLIPSAESVFWLVRLLTTSVVFLAWSFPLWRRVFRVRNKRPPLEQ
jgi:putative flippase GtrA